jgi:hypothetical protein
MLREGGGAYHRPMMRSYEARNFRFADPSTTIRKGVGEHRYNAADDVNAVRAAKTLHAAFYDPATYQIILVELREGEKERFVTFSQGSLDV